MSERIVNSFASLSAAVAAADVDYIYFSGDIELTAGISIPPAKSALVFDGRYEGVTHRLTDMNSVYQNDTIGIRQLSNIAITFKNMTINGRNYYGIPNIVGDSLFFNNKNVSVTYENVTYSGPQIAFNPDGLVRFIDCNISIQPGEVATVEEVGEVNRVEFEGSNTIRHTGSTDAVFWFRGSSGNEPYFKVLEGASVDIRTTDYFMYNWVPLRIAFSPVAFEVGQNASLTLATDHGFSYDSGHRITSFLVGDGASFRYTQQTPNEKNASMYVNGSFTVGHDANVYMEANFANAYPLIHFATGTVPPLTVNNPLSFVLYDKSAAPISLDNSAARNFTLSGGQINHWLAAKDFPLAGSFEDRPNSKWNRPNWEPFSISGRVTSTGTTVSGTTLTPEEQGGLPSINDLVFQSARVISVGNLPIHADVVADDGRLISGVTSPGAKVKVTFTTGGGEQKFETTAGSDGSFAIDPGMTISAGTVITIGANLPFLITYIETTVVPVHDEITIQSAPILIEFGMPPIISSPDVLLGRRYYDDPVEILDSRTVRTPWTLMASTTGPLVADSGEILANSVVFRAGNGNVFVVGETPIPVYDGVPKEGVTAVVWEAEYGILVRLREPIRAGVAYRTTLKWELDVT